MNIGLWAFILIALFLIGSVYTLKVVSKDKKNAQLKRSKERVDPHYDDESI